MNNTEAKAMRFHQGGRGRREEKKKQKDQGKLFIEKASPKEMAEEVKNKKCMMLEKPSEEEHAYNVVSIILEYRKESNANKSLLKNLVHSFFFFLTTWPAEMKSNHSQSSSSYALNSSTLSALDSFNLLL